MRRFKVLCKQSSIYAPPDARIEYKVGKWVTAPDWLAEQGYYPLVFQTLEQAQEFRNTVTVCQELEIWECEVRGKVSLKPLCNLDVLEETGLLEEFPEDWPPGTEMWKEIKLLKEVK